MKYLWSILFVSSLATVYAQNIRLFKVWYDGDRRYIKETYYVKYEDSTVLHGEYMTFYQNFNIKTQGQYKDNIATGPWVYYYENGNKKMEGEIDNFLQTGIWRYYYENGNISMIGPMVKGKKDGYWRFYYEDGKPKSEGHLHEGKNDGDWIYYYDDGVTKAKANYNNGIGKYTEYYEDGTLKMEGMTKFGKSDSLWSYYYPNGKLKARGYEDNGLRVGKWQFFFDTGKLASEGIYKDGQTNGEWKYYNTDGTLSATGAEKNGQKEGQWRMFYANGKVKGDGIFNEGDGVYTEYYENQSIKIKGIFTKGKYDGKWTYYYDNGVLEGECIYANGEGWYTGYYQDGAKKMEGLLKEGNKIGVWKLYKNDGGIAGYYKTYYEDYDNKKEEPQKTKADTISSNTAKETKRPRKRLRLYTPNPLVYKTFIVSIDALGPIAQKIPINLEYYVQDKWGVEFSISYLRRPMFTDFDNVPILDIYQDGYSQTFRYKRYQYNEEFIGRPYLGGGVTLKNSVYKTNALDTTTQTENTNAMVTLITPIVYQVDERNTLEVFILAGDRFFKKYNKSGFTIDIQFALGMGYKNPEKQFINNMEIHKRFSDVSENKIYPVFNFALNVGYAF
ncbi:MAG: hypothetical protein NW207_05560 [Cytophagales bacterium]|nr:hypothetical protein [Cytophagales bacterium]